MNRNVSIIKIRTAFKFAELLLPQFEKPLYNEEIHLGTIRQLDYILPSHVLFGREKLPTNYGGIVFGVFF